MFFHKLPALTVVLSIAASLAGIANATPTVLVERAAADNTVKINSVSDYCLILPRNRRTNIGDSESEHTSSLQGRLPSNFWSRVTLSRPKGRGRIIQLTGCIRPETVDRLNTRDGGGQYDSSGGAGGQGNPRGSVCEGYKHYVELVEPDVRRACIRCCDNYNDCPLSHDQDGCPVAIPGNYAGCS